VPSTQRDWRSTLTPTPGRHDQVSSRLGRQKQLLEAWTGRLLETSPVIHRYQDRGIDPSLRHDLRPLLESCLQELAETSLGILQLPASGHVKRLV
jgi:hypothetical protein